MDLFGNEDEPKPVTTAASKMRLGDRWYNSDKYFSRFLVDCPVCKKRHIMEHVMIKTREEILKDGAIEIEPFVFNIKSVCSRQCELKNARLKIQ